MWKALGGYLRQHHLALVALFIALGGTSYATVERSSSSGRLYACVTRAYQTLNLTGEHEEFPSGAVQDLLGTEWGGAGLAAFVGQLAPWDRRARLARRGRLARLARRVIRGRLARSGRKVRRATRARRVRLARPARKDRQDLRPVQRAGI